MAAKYVKVLCDNDVTVFIGSAKFADNTKKHLGSWFDENSLPYEYRENEDLGNYVTVAINPKIVTSISFVFTICTNEDGERRFCVPVINYQSLEECYNKMVDYFHRESGICHKDINRMIKHNMTHILEKYIQSQSLTDSTMKLVNIENGTPNAITVIGSGRYADEMKVVFKDEEMTKFVQGQGITSITYITDENLEDFVIVHTEPGIMTGLDIYITIDKFGNFGISRSSKADLDILRPHVAKNIG
jgi:hypothetical protein